MAIALDSLGHGHHHLGAHQPAVTHYQQAVGLFRKVGDRYEEAVTLLHLGHAQRAVGDLDGTRDTWRQALRILDELDHPDAGPVRVRFAL